jgi:hypothetical protein
MATESKTQTFRSRTRLVLTAEKHWAPAAAPSLDTSPLVNSFQPASPRASVARRALGTRGLNPAERAMQNCV